jgi:molybdate transport system ATP-binding protein
MAGVGVTELVARLQVPGRVEAELVASSGDVVAVIGPNGAGKSTLLAALAGLVPVEGSVLVDGRSWTDPPLSVRDRGVGMVFQDQRLFPHLSALDNIAFGLRAKGMKRGEADALSAGWLERFGIGDLAGRRPDQLSGGQAQRVAISRALVLDPVLLLLDEPFAGLDVGVASALRSDLAQHLASYRGITVIVTHDAIDALTLANLIVVLDRGRVAQVGTPHEVAARPRTEHVARLVGLNLVREGDRWVSFSPGVVTVSLHQPDGSARHRWSGVIAHAAPYGRSIRLLVNGAAQELLADVTPASVSELGLVSGRRVWLSVKESAVTSYSTPTSS